jgi:Dolichyl-phosphate-mannose-protein mannosyltransferase
MLIPTNKIDGLHIISLQSLARIGRFVLVIIATLYLVSYGIIALARLQYPFELEWIEGASLETVNRILAGKAIYARPSLEFVASVYNPLYFYIAAGLTKILGGTFTSLRLLSFLASLGCLATIFAIVKSETSRNLPSLLATGLFAATFKVSGSWFDLARVDSLFIFFSLLALYLVRFGRTFSMSILAGAIVWLSFLTKQTESIVFMPVAIYCIAIKRRYAFVLVSTAFGLIGLSILAMNLLTDGWYGYYATMPSGYAFDKLVPILFWSSDIIRPLGIAFALAIVWSIYSVCQDDRKLAFFYISLSLGTIGASMLARSQSGGYLNNLIPAYASISILFGMAIDRLLSGTIKLDLREAKIAELCIYAICTIQFFNLFYNPLSQIPNTQDLQSGRQILQEISRIKGSVFIPDCGYLATLVGKPAFSHHAAVADVVRTKDSRSKTQLVTEISDAIKNKIFNAIIISESKDTGQVSSWFPELYANIDENYSFEKKIFKSKLTFWPKTGMEIRPSLLYVPKTMVARD